MPALVIEDRCVNLDPTDVGPEQRPVFLSVGGKAERKELSGGQAMIIKSPYVTEKVTGMIDSNDTLEFLVNMQSTKPEIKKALEELYDVEVVSIRTMITSRGEKKAIVKLAKEGSANELAGLKHIFELLLFLLLLLFKYGPVGKNDIAPFFPVFGDSE